MRVALFGGSFDPPHRGHVAIAKAAADAFRLDRVLFAPVGRQPLKRDALIASFEDRLAMVRLACEGDSRLVASDMDAPTGDGTPNYTVDTLVRLGARFPGAELFCVVGVDAFKDMPRWREPDRLRSLAEWIVVTRPGYSVEIAEAGGGKHLLETVHEDVSATDVRERLREGLRCQDLVPVQVLRYIEEHGLYRRQ
ncbi:nicotinate-nucleotide adenylyltransferase [Granulicella sibirica]|uniref:Probable nicotinate-nucleotide adenylyltransferase n=1 Tax=Granulicella sibirica TaxID=2479048 RepID=A0A4V1L683_9BACT|nr:nicotinate-nucleotide adenylyltransferase [Granulicella sibirica]RXH58364.1 Nicotinate-nucleotide adenylyltransferase [Granulicella sibirica]